MGASPQEAIDEGSYQCWKLIKEPSPLGSWATVLIWNTSGFFSCKMIYLWCCGPEAGRASGKLRAGRVLGSFATTVNLAQADAAPVAGHRVLPDSLRGLQGNDRRRGSSLGALERRPGCVPFRTSPLRPTRPPQHRPAAPRRPLAPGLPAPRQTPGTQGHCCLRAPRG